MVARLRMEIDRLKQDLLALGTVVEEQLFDAERSIREHDRPLAHKVINRDPEVDQMEVELEEECLKILALHQPVAIDLRIIVAILKINNDLERIGDLATNIAARAYDLAEIPDFQFPPELSDMTHKVQDMVAKALKALVDTDAALAEAVLQADNAVDDINRSMYDKTQQAIQADVEKTRQSIMILSVSRYLERIADQATNIAEDVIYMVDGRIVRHGLHR